MLWRRVRDRTLLALVDLFTAVYPVLLLFPYFHLFALTRVEKVCLLPSLAGLLPGFVGLEPFFFGHHRQELLFTRFLTFLCLILSKFYPVFSHLLTVWTGFRRILLDFSSYYLLKRTFTYVYEFFLSFEK